MKAMVRDDYGSPDVLRLEEVPTPTPRDNEVLIKVHASSLSSSDWEILVGKPFYVRPLFGLRRPKVRILGSDIAGRVEAVGNAVTKWKPGDELFGDTMWHGFGCFAEYVCVPETTPMVVKPPSMNFEEAATVPQSAVIAMQGLRSLEGAKVGTRVLINGAGGGSGSFAVQLAKLRGAEVTGVDTARKLEMVRSIGADHVINCLDEDFTRSDERYDLILDVAAHHSIFDYMRSLSPHGQYLATGGRMWQSILLGPGLSMVSGKRLSLLRVEPNAEDLARIGDLFADQSLKAVIDRRFSLGEVPEALSYFGDGLARGKVIIRM